MIASMDPKQWFIAPCRCKPLVSAEQVGQSNASKASKAEHRKLSNLRKAMGEKQCKRSRRHQAAAGGYQRKSRRPPAAISEKPARP